MITFLITGINPENDESNINYRRRYYSTSSIKNLNVYSADGNAKSQVSGQVPVVVKQVFDTMKVATGVDMADIVKSNTIQAKTNRNFDVDIKK